MSDSDEYSPPKRSRVSPTSPHNSQSSSQDFNPSTSTINGYTSQNRTSSRNIHKRPSDEDVSSPKRTKPISGVDNVGQGECGIIEHICLVNFMCHKKLEVDFCKNVNLVLGRNGSGKSAIMTAIYVGLGGKALCTNRASSLKSFIQKGKLFSEVTIILKNTGEDAYQPEVYGTKIIVTRRLTQDGSTTYKIQSSIKKTIATTKEELSHILEQFSIQIENPVSMLNQDTSRSFLTTNKPMDLYNLFMKATHLEQMLQDYKHVDECINKVKGVLSVKDGQTNDMRVEIKRLEQIYHGMDQIKLLEDQLRIKASEHAWSLVKEREKEIAPMEIKIHKLNSILTKCDCRIAENKETAKQLESNIASIKTEFENIGNLAKTNTEERRAWSIKISKTKELKSSMNIKINNLNREVDSNQNERKVYEEKINEIRIHANENLSEIWQKRDIEIMKMKQEFENIENRLSEIQTRQNNFDKNHIQEKISLNTAKTDYSENEHKLAETQKRLSIAKQGQGDKIHLFGRNMTNLIDRIKRNNNFSHTPKGPIGIYLAVKEKKWTMAIERCIGAQLKSFLVNNMNDQNILSKIFRELNIEGHSIVVSEFTGNLYNINRFKAESEFHTVYDMITCLDVDVVNYLVDTAKIEMCLLISESKIAMDVMYRSPPQNAIKAYTEAGDMVEKSKKFFSNRILQPKYLSEDIRKSVKIYSEKIDELINKQNHLKNECMRIKDKILNIENELTKLSQDTRKISNKKSEYSRNIDSLKSKTEEEQSRNEDIEPYENALEKICENEKELIGKINSIKSENKRISDLLQNEIKDSKAVEQKIEGFKIQLEELKKSLRELTDKREESETAIEHYNKKRNDVEDTIRNKQQECDGLLKESEELAAKALQLGDKIDTLRKPSTIKSEIMKTEKAIIEQQNNQVMSREEVTIKLDEEIKRYNKHNNEIEILLKLYKQLKKALKMRLDKQIDLTELMGIRANKYFRMLLQQRNYNGRIVFDHNTSQLSLQVTTDLTKKNKSTKNTSTLSGGERSYTTVCFIMSLWEAMESPFRCLDEFDVFMDMVNRSTCISIMMSTAAQYRDRQFIFFTPLDITSYTTPHNIEVKILQLSEPERGSNS